MSAPAISRTPPIDEPVDPDKYILGTGDVLELNFWGLQNFRMRMIVDVEGRAFVPKVGYFSLAGKTLSQARRLLRESVARYYPRLGFDVTLAEPRTFLVQVVDDVVSPGSYTARAIERVSTLITRAGGFGKDASRRRVEIQRRDGTVARADLLLYTQTGDVKHNPFLLDGDVVRVPYEELAATIDGAVNRPGRYELIGTRDLAELVELAGGLAPRVTRKLPITVVRRAENDRQDLTLVEFGEQNPLPPASISHEDIVRIPSFEELQQAVMVVGALAGANAADEVSSTRRLTFVKGDSVRTLLERVGGVGPLADLHGGYILRQGKSVPVDLNALVALRDMKADRPVDLGDTVVVPFKRRTILVQGAVFKPGPYPYNPNYGVEQYVALAGGSSRNAQSISNARIVSPSGETRKYKRDLKVEPGSTLVVPERNFSRPELVQIAISIAGVLLSGAAIVISTRK
jgi:protein involved in polysaccharide export with SLBB domain